MSSATSGWNTKEYIGTFSCNDSGWGASNSSGSVSSPLSHPDNWPQLGAGQEPEPQKLDASQLQNQSFSDNIMPQQPGHGGWGAPSAPSNPSPATGWGMPPPAPQGAGWGGAAASSGGSWSRQPQVDNGTALWGKQSQSGSGWGVPPASTQPPAPQSSWNSAPPPATASSAPQQPGQEEKTVQPVPLNSSSDAPSSQPESWAAAAAATPTRAQPGQSQPPTSSAKPPPTGGNEAEKQEPKTQQQEQDIMEPEDATRQAQSGDEVRKLVDSHEGWGKRPIQQDTSWDISDSPSYTGQPPNKTGTEAWGKAPPGKPAPGWQGGAGGPSDPSPQQQWANKPAGNPPARGWVTMAPQSQMPSRPPWSGVQPNNPPPQAGWGDPRLPSPANPINTNRWNAPPNNPMPNAGNQGWGTSNVQAAGWKNPASGDNSGWGNNGQRNPPASNWSAPPLRPEGSWNQPQNMQRPSMVDDGTSAWGDPNNYRNVNLWDKKSGAAMGAGDAGQGKPEPSGWGAPATPQGANNKPSPTGWGDVNPSKPSNDGPTPWAKASQRSSNWDQGQVSGIGKPENSNGWSGNVEQSGPQWGQPDNDPSRVKGQDFGFVDRKTVAGGDSVFEDGPLDRNLNGMGGDIGGGANYGPFSVASNNSAMANHNGPRPMPPQNLMGLPGQFRQAPPQPPGQLQQQIRQAVMKGLIPPQLLHPQLMTPQHINNLQQFITKTNDYQQLSTRVNLLSKQPNIPPQMRSQQLDQLSRMQRQLQQQILNLQRMLTQNSMQKPAPPFDKGGMGRSTGMGPDLPPSSGTMPPMNSMMSPFNMSSMSQGLPNTTGNPMNREQQSRLHTWRRPSAGFDSPAENPASIGLGGGMPTSISEMIGGGLGLLNSYAEQGGLLGLRQPGNARGVVGEQSNGANDFRHREAQSNDEAAAVMATDPEQEASNLKNMLADIGPPEFIPGKKWAGFRPIDPENDPDITPGSVAIAKTMSVNTVKDADQVLNRERYTTSQLDTTAPNIVNVSVKTQPALASSFASDNHNAMASPSSWSAGTPRWTDNGKMWLVLTSISPQLDPHSLRALCSMSGKMVSFQPNYPTRGMALVKYQTSEDALLVKSKLAMSFAGNVLNASVASEQEINNFINSSNGNWNPGSSGRQLFGSAGALPNHHPQGLRNFGGPMMQNSDLPYGGGGDTHNLWSTADNSMMPPQGAAQWSTGVNHAPGRPMSMWNNGPFDNPRTASPHNLLPENLLGEHTF